MSALSETAPFPVRGQRTAQGDQRRSILTGSERCSSPAAIEFRSTVVLRKGGSLVLAGVCEYVWTFQDSRGCRNLYPPAALGTGARTVGCEGGRPPPRSTDWPLADTRHGKCSHACATKVSRHAEFRLCVIADPKFYHSQPSRRKQFDCPSQQGLARRQTTATSTVLSPPYPSTPFDTCVAC